VQPRLVRASSCIAGLVALALGVACAAPAPLATATATATAPEMPGSDAVGDPHWPIPPRRAEALLGRSPLRFESLAHAGAGLSGAQKGRVRIQGLAGPVQVKWKPMPPDLDGINNSPRREIATYRLQALFLEPARYVVPTTAARCLPPEAFPDASTPAVDAARPCVLGTLALWLDDVVVPERLHDPDHLARDPAHAAALARFNVLTYLALHRDGRSGNFLVSRREAGRRAFAIDNGITFSGFFYNWFADNWDELKVGLLPAGLVARLHAIRPADLEALAVVCELAPDEGGILRPVPPSAPWSTERGARRRARDGAVQLGLTRKEIDGVAERLRELLAAVDRGEIAVF